MSRILYRLVDSKIFLPPDVSANKDGVLSTLLTVTVSGPQSVGPV